MSVSSNNNKEEKEKNEDSSSFVDNDSSSKTKSSLQTKKMSLIEENLRDNLSAYSKDEKVISRVVQRLVKEGKFSPQDIHNNVEKIQRETIESLLKKYSGKNNFIAKELGKMYKNGEFSSKNTSQELSGTMDTPFKDLINLTAKKENIKASQAVEELASLEEFSKHLEDLEKRAIENGKITEKITEEDVEEIAKVIEDEKNGEEVKIKSNKKEKGKLTKDKAKIEAIKKKESEDSKKGIPNFDDKVTEIKKESQNRDTYSAKENIINEKRALNPEEIEKEHLNIEKPKLKTESSGAVKDYRIKQETRNLDTAVLAMISKIGSATDSKEFKSIKENLEENAKDYPESDNVKKALGILRDKETEFEGVEIKKANTINKYKTDQEEQNLNVTMMAINSQVDSATDPKELKVVQEHLEEIAKDYPNDTGVQISLENLHKKIKIERVKVSNSKTNSVDPIVVSGIAGVAAASIAAGSVVSGVGIAGVGDLASAKGGSVTPNKKNLSKSRSKKGSVLKSPKLSTDRSATPQKINVMSSNNLASSFALKSKMEKEGFSPASPSGSHSKPISLEPVTPENATELPPSSASEPPSTDKPSPISTSKSAPVDISAPDDSEILLPSQDSGQSFGENKDNQKQRMPGTSSQDRPIPPVSSQKSSLKPSLSPIASDSSSFMPSSTSPAHPKKSSSIPSTSAPKSKSDSDLSKINFGANPKPQEATSTPKSSSSDEKQLENEELKKYVEPQMREELTKLLKVQAEEHAALGGNKGGEAGSDVESNNRALENQSGSNGGADGNMDNSLGSSRGNMGNSKSLKERKQELNKFRKNAPEKMRNLGRNARDIPKKTQEIAANARKKAEALKKISKDDIKKAMALKKAALKKQLALREKNLKKNLKKKIKINAKYGKSPYMSCLFMIMMFIAFVNDILLDIFVGLVLQVIGLIMTVSVVAAAFGAPLIAVVSAASKIIDVVTVAILTIFSLITGGVTKASMGKQIFNITRLVIAVGVEEVDVINLAPSWMIVILINWMIMRGDATQAEKAQK